MTEAQKKQENQTDEQQVAQSILTLLENIDVDKLGLPTSHFVNVYTAANHWLSAFVSGQRESRPAPAPKLKTVKSKGPSKKRGKGKG